MGGTELPTGARLPMKGYCFSRCAHNSAYDIKKRIICKNPHMDDAWRQYDPLPRLYRFLTLNKYKKNKAMDPENGWKCSADLVPTEATVAEDDVEEFDYVDPD